MHTLSLLPPKLLRATSPITPSPHLFVSLWPDAKIIIVPSGELLVPKHGRLRPLSPVSTESIASHTQPKHGLAVLVRVSVPRSPMAEMSPTVPATRRASATSSPSCPTLCTEVTPLFVPHQHLIAQWNRPPYLLTVPTSVRLALLLTIPPLSTVLGTLGHSALTKLNSLVLNSKTLLTPTLTRHPPAVVHTTTIRPLIGTGPHRGRPKTLPTCVFRVSRLVASVLSLELNRENVVSLSHRVSLIWTGVVTPPTVPTRVEFLICEIESFVPTVGSKFVPNTLALRHTRLLATETIPAGTHVDILFVRALTTGRVASEFLFSPLDSSVVSLRSSERRQKILFGQVLCLGVSPKRRESAWHVVVRPSRLLQITSILRLPLTYLLFTV